MAQNPVARVLEMAGRVIDQGDPHTMSAGVILDTIFEEFAATPGAKVERGKSGKIASIYVTDLSCGFERRTAYGFVYDLVRERQGQPHVRPSWSRLD